MNKIYKRSIYTKNEAGLTFLLSLFLPGFLFITIALLLFPTFIISGDGGNLSIFISIMSIFATQGGFFLIWFFMNKAGRINAKKASKISFKLNLKNLLLTILIAFVAFIGLQGLVGIFDVIIQKMGYIPQEFPLPFNSIWWLFINIVLVALLPAISEELVFRGIIYNGMKQYGRVKAIIFSALLFSLVHTNIEQTIYPFIFGIILAFIVHKTDNIFYAILAHFLNNATVLVSTYLIQNNLMPDIFSLPTLNAKTIILAIAIAAATLSAIHFISKFYKKDKSTLVSLTQEQKDALIDNLLENPQAPEQSSGINKEQWEVLITQKNDAIALETARKTINGYLWVGVALGVLLWLSSL